jgi:Outer membrane protein beta-barrel domain
MDMNKKIIVALAALAMLPVGRTHADEPRPQTPFQVAPYAGAFIPTGDLRDTLDDAALAGLTLSYEMNRYLSVVGSFGWAPTKVKTLSDADLDLFQYDLGLQGQYAFDVGYGLHLTPFVGAGIGGRTYRYRDLGLENETDLIGYFSAGGTVEYQKITLSVTGRDNISRYNGLGFEDHNTTRNDVTLFTSVGYRF